MNEQEVPVARAAALRHDAEHYLAMRRSRVLRMPAALERGGDDNARAVMRLTANTPPPRVVAEKLVA